jgi:diguanylate cyclase (GGDEF)-like protein
MALGKIIFFGNDLVFLRFVDDIEFQIPDQKYMVEKVRDEGMLFHFLRNNQDFDVLLVEWEQLQSLGNEFYGRLYDTSPSLQILCLTHEPNELKLSKVLAAHVNLVLRYDLELKDFIQSVFRLCQRSKGLRNRWDSYRSQFVYLDSEHKKLQKERDELRMRLRLRDEEIKKLKKEMEVVQEKATQLEIRLDLDSREDKLTGLINRWTMQEQLEFEEVRSIRTGKSFSVLLCDIDKFCTVNEFYSEAFGDQVLVMFSRFLRDQLRRMDRLSRWGPDEFLILLPETNLDGAKTVASKILYKLYDHYFKFEDKKLKLALSIGIGVFYPGQSHQEYVKIALNELNTAKKSGGATFSCHHALNQTESGSQEPDSDDDLLEELGLQ